MVYRTGVFDESEAEEVAWWDPFPVLAAGYCGPGDGCAPDPDNDWLQWSVLYDDEPATGNTNYIVDGSRIALETEIIAYQPLPVELRVNYLDPNSPSVAQGVDLFPQVVTELRSSLTGGTAPFSVNFGMTMANNCAFYRRLAFRLDTLLANGTFLYNHRAGFTNVAPYNRFETSVKINLPAFSSLDGENVFTLHAEDVTPAPYNQPPFPPAGAADSHAVTIDVTVP